MYLRGHSNVAATSLLQLKREVWLNSNNAFLHTSKWSKWRVSHLQGFLKRPIFTGNTIHGQTGLGRPLLDCKMWLPPIEKRHIEAFLVGWDGGGEEEPCRRNHDLIVCLCPKGKSSPGQLQTPPFALHQTQLCDPGESHLVLTPADLCRTPEKKPQAQEEPHLPTREIVSDCQWGNPHWCVFICSTQTQIHDRFNCYDTQNEVFSCTIKL